MHMPRSLWRFLVGAGDRSFRSGSSSQALGPSPQEDRALEISPNDPLLAYLLSAPGVIEVDRLALDSPALQGLKEAGVKVTVPLISQGELVGLLNLGPLRSEQEFSSDDRKLLSDLAAQTAPAVRLAQLVREQQKEAQERERIDQELRVARLIQQTLLPKDVPHLPDWQVGAYYRPAREVGGDFYDFLELPGGHLGFVVADVTDKGVPAALVMATARSVLRAAALRLVSPGVVLERVNEMLCSDMPPNMFVTCLYAVLEPSTGLLRYANAGHCLPYWRTSSGAAELRATGMPLGLMPEMHYEEQEVVLQRGESILFHTDGLAEAHSAQREMFGCPRLQRLVGSHPGGSELIPFLLSQLTEFTGPSWEQEDDVTLVTLQWEKAAVTTGVPSHAGSEGQALSWQGLDEFTISSEPGNERPAAERVAQAVRGLLSPQARVERLKTAVAEATMNAMEHGNKYQRDLQVAIQVRASTTALSVLITDQGGDAAIPEPLLPDLEAKLAGLQSPRGWGLFLIKNLVDEANTTSDERHHTVELIMHLRETHDDA